MDADEEARRVEEAAAGSALAGEDDDWEMDEPAAAPPESVSRVESEGEPGEPAPITDGGGAMPAGVAVEAEPAQVAALEAGTAPKKTVVRKVTAYVVLVETRVQMGTEPAVMWREVGTFSGPKALDDAHRTFEGKEHGALVAVPSRSWKPKRPVEKKREPLTSWE